MDISEKEGPNLVENSALSGPENLTLNSLNEEEKVDESEAGSTCLETRGLEDAGSLPFLPKKPRKSNNPLHILIQECSRQYILDCLCKKPESCQRQLISDFDHLKDDLKLFCNYEVLESAKEFIVSKNEKFQYEDMNLDSEVRRSVF